MYPVSRRWSITPDRNAGWGSPRTNPKRKRGLLYRARQDSIMSMWTFVHFLTGTVSQSPYSVALGSFLMDSGLVDGVHDYQKTRCFLGDPAVENG